MSGRMFAAVSWGPGWFPRQSRLGHSSSSHPHAYILTSSAELLMLRCHITASVASPFIQTMAYFQTMIRWKKDAIALLPTVLW
jgi:hypothetical protein